MRSHKNVFNPWSSEPTSRILGKFPQEIIKGSVKNWNTKVFTKALFIIAKFREKHILNIKDETEIYIFLQITCSHTKISSTS